MGKPKLFVLAAVALALVAAVPMLSTAAAAAPAPERSHTAAAGTLVAGSAADVPMAKGYATKAEADAATAEFKKTYGDRLTRATPGQCTGSWIVLNETVGYFDHSDPNPAYLMGYISAGYAPCRSLALGGRYNGCGYTNANGWILMPDVFGFHGYPWAGYSISACTVDP